MTLSCADLSEMGARTKWQARRDGQHGHPSDNHLTYAVAAPKHVSEIPPTSPYWASKEFATWTEAARGAPAIALDLAASRSGSSAPSSSEINSSSSRICRKSRVPRRSLPLDFRLKYHSRGSEFRGSMILGLVRG